MPITFSFDNCSYSTKPSHDEARIIQSRLGRNMKSVEVNDLPETINMVGAHGYSIAPGIFRNGKKTKDNFIQQQLFMLDFDNTDSEKRGTITPAEFMKRCRRLGIPITAMYETFSSTKAHPRFRAIFLNDAPVTDKRLVEDMNRMLGTIFPEADHCWKNYAGMYFGGKHVIYVNHDLTDTINVDTLIQAHNQWVHLSDKSGKHYQEKINRFWKNGKPQIASCDAVEKVNGAGCALDQSDGSAENGGNLPSSIILETNIRDGKNPPFYKVTYPNQPTRTTKSSTAPSEHNTSRSSTLQRKRYRSSTLKKIPSVCQLFNEFIKGHRILLHDELFGLATNLSQVEGGRKVFLDIIDQYPLLHDNDDPRSNWERQFSYIKKEWYQPGRCDNYCQYKNVCPHRTNILLTVAPKFMEKIDGYSLGLRSREEVQEETERAIRKACDALDTRVHVINSMTAVGKTTIFIRIVSERSNERFLIAEPTNLMKHECCDRLKAAGVGVMETPSLEELKDELSDDLWSKLSKMRNRGDETTPYIAELVRLGKCSKSNAKILKKYLKQKQKLKTFKGAVVTTHRYLVMCDEKWLNSFDHVIIDEDILYKLIATSHEDASMHTLEKIADATPDSALKDKIKQLKKKLKDGSGYIKLPSINYNADAVPGAHSLNMKAFCEAEHFYVRSPQDEPGLKKAMVSFAVSLKLPADRKLIVVSATANEDVYEQFFGSEHVKFKMCHRAPYEGTLKQYYGLSMSRACLNSHPGIIPFLYERLGIPKEYVITYKGMAIGILHFGNAEGSNMLEDEDILIVGSAYQPPFIYVLAAAALGFPISDTTYEQQWVDHNGCHFKYQTFDDEDLCTIQFWMTESELEQAVGRARLLWHDCTVYLFSNFPVQQAQMIDGYTVYGDFVRKAKTTKQTD